MAVDVHRPAKPPPDRFNKSEPASDPYHLAPDNQAFKPQETVTSYTSNVAIEFPIDPHNTLNEQMTALFATLQQHDPKLVLLTRENTSNDASGIRASIPQDTITFAKYVNQSITSTTNMKAHVTLRSNVPFNQLKYNSQTINHLKQFDIWMSHHTISGNHIIPVVWLYRINPNHTSKYELTAAIKKQLPATFPEFQLRKRTIYYHSEEGLSTDAWCLEINRKNTSAAFTQIMKHLPLDGQYPALPMNSRSDSKGKIKQLFISHNKYLHNTVSIRVDNLRHIDLPLTTTDENIHPSIREQVHKMKTHDDKPLFLGTSQYNSKRVNFICLKQNETIARNTLNDFIGTYLTTQLHSKHLGPVLCNTKPVMTGSIKVPDQITVFTEQLQATNFPELDYQTTSIHHMKPPSIQKRKVSYSDAVTNATLSQISPTLSGTQETISGITPVTPPTPQPSHMTKTIESMLNKIQTLETAQQNQANCINTLTTQLNRLTKCFEETIDQVTTLQPAISQMQAAQTAQFEHIMSTLQILTCQPQHRISTKPTIMKHHSSHSTLPSITEEDYESIKGLTDQTSTEQFQTIQNILPNPKSSLPLAPSHQDQPQRRHTNDNLSHSTQSRGDHEHPT